MFAEPANPQYPTQFSILADQALSAIGTRAEYPTNFSVTSAQTLRAKGTRTEYPTDFSVTAAQAIRATGTRAAYPTHFSVTASQALSATGTRAEYPTHFSVTASQALSATGTRAEYPTHFSVTAGQALSATGTRAEYPTHFSVTASQALSATGTRAEYPAHFSVTAGQALSATGTRAEYPTHFSVTAGQALSATGVREPELTPEQHTVLNRQGQTSTLNKLNAVTTPFRNKNNNLKPLSGTAANSASIAFIPLFSLVQVTPLEYRGIQLQPFEPDTVVEQINDRITERRDAVSGIATGGSSGGDSTDGDASDGGDSTAGDTGGGSNGGGSPGGGSTGGDFMAMSLPVTGPLPINSTDGQINLDYNPSGMRSLRVFNESSTGAMPIRRVLTTSGVSAGAVQINIDDDFFEVVSRIPGGDVTSAPGGQTIVVRDYADGSYLQIQITVGSANFFGDHSVENIVGWYCGTDPAGCPL